MENKKISFKDIKGMLSRDEMKQIKGGSGGVGKGGCCSQNSDCTSGNCAPATISGACVENGKKQCA